MYFDLPNFYQRGDPHFHSQLDYKNHSAYADFSPSVASKFILNVRHIFIKFPIKIISFRSFLKNDVEEAMEQEKSESREEL